MTGDVSDWLSNAGGALIKVADSAGSTVEWTSQDMGKLFSLPDLYESKI